MFLFKIFLFCFIHRADSTTAETGSEVARSHGLSSFGLEVVAEMNRLGKQVSQKTFQKKQDRNQLFDSSFL